MSAVHINTLNHQCSAHKYTKIISAVHTNTLKLIEVFNELMESQNSVTVREERGYLNNLENFTIVFLLTGF